MEKSKTYAVCPDCKREMVLGGGCSYRFIRAEGGEWLERFKHTHIQPCHDCNAGLGKYHHMGCDWEKCPNCSMQLIGCECDMVELSIIKAIKNETSN